MIKNRMAHSKQWHADVLDFVEQDALDVDVIDVEYKHLITCKLFTMARRRGARKPKRSRRRTRRGGNRARSARMMMSMHPYGFT